MIETNDSEYNSVKILDFEKAIKKSSELKELGKTVGLCHGSFDILHPGHIKHLESASKLCDFLFVSITSDKYVSMRKGNSRPIFSEKSRAYSVASLHFVDFVFVSDFEKGREVIEKIKPSVYIKGPDYINRDTSGINAERKAIESVGGEIKFTADCKVSSTSIIRHIREGLKRESMLIGIDRDGTLIEDINYLGKEDNWRDKVRLKKEVLHLLSYLESRFDMTKIAITNQQGVARGYLDTDRVEIVNSYVDSLLKKENISIDRWEYCPDVDAVYASSIKEASFNPEYVKEKTKRKPSSAMLADGLSKLGRNIGDFDRIVIIGNSEDDMNLAKNLKVPFIDVTGKNYEQLREEFDSLN